MKRDVQIGVRITSELKKRLERLAEADQRKLADYIRIVLEKHAKQRL